MAERFVYLNGDYVPERDAKVSVLDRGFRWGDAVYDATRTFGGRLFKLHEHVERFFRSLRYARIDPRLDKAAVTALCEEVVRRNEPARVAADGPGARTASPRRPPRPFGKAAPFERRRSGQGAARPGRASAQAEGQAAPVLEG